MKLVLFFLDARGLLDEMASCARIGTSMEQRVLVFFIYIGVEEELCPMDVEKCCHDGQSAYFIKEASDLYTRTDTEIRRDSA